MMDFNDYLKLLEDNTNQLTKLLDHCQEGPDELVLLASMMRPILQDFIEAQKNLQSSQASQETILELQDET